MYSKIFISARINIEVVFVSRIILILKYYLYRQNITISISCLLVDPCIGPHQETIIQLQ